MRGSRAAVVSHWPEADTLYLREVVLVFGIPAVNGAQLQRVAPYDLRKVVLPTVEVLAIVPRREAPNRWQPTAIDPHRGIIRIRRTQEWLNHAVERLLGRRSRLRDVDAIRRVRKLKVVHRGAAEDLA